MNVLTRYNVAKSSGYTTKEAIGVVLINLGMFKHAFALKGNMHMRRELAMAGHCHEVLFMDDAPEVRAVVAAHGSFLEELQNDPIEYVRHQAELYKEHYLTSNFAGNDIIPIH